MTLLNPLALLLLLMGVPIILMYILRLRRRDQPVSSTLLWRRVLEDVQANAPWQRLRRNILLFLQLLALAALVLALARPAYSRARTVTGDLVVIVDVSYAMRTHDVAPSRFSAALDQVQRLARDLGPGNVMSVIAMGAQPQLVVAQSPDPATIARSLEALHTVPSPPNFLAALSLAASLARNSGGGQSDQGFRGTRIIVLTSRESGIKHLPIAVSLPVEIIRIGAQHSCGRGTSASRCLRDLGITNFQVGRSGGHVRALLSIRNFGGSEASSDADLEVGRGSGPGEHLQLADVRPVHLAPGQEVNLFWNELPSSAQRLHAKLAQRDDFESDKNAWAVVPSGQTRTVLLVSKATTRDQSRDYFLRTALAVDPTVRPYVVSPAVYTATLARNFDIIVFDHFLPRSLPATSALLVSPPAGRVGFPGGAPSASESGYGAVRFGTEKPVGNINLASPSAYPALRSVLNYVDFSDVHIALSRTISLPGWLQPLAVSGDMPLIAAGDTGSLRVALIGFDLQKSDWPLRVSFPVTFQNLLHYLTPGLTLGATTIKEGESVTLFPDGGASAILVRKPDGSVERLTRPFVPFTDTGSPGFYQVQEVGTATNGTATFAVSFLHPRIDSVDGPSVITFARSGRTAVTSTSGTPSRASGGTVGDLAIPTSVAWTFGALALLMLTGEWWFAFRQ